MAKRWLVVFPDNKFLCFLDSEITCLWIVIMPANELYLDDFRDIGEALVVQHAVNVVSTF